MLPYLSTQRAERLKLVQYLREEEELREGGRKERTKVMKDIRKQCTSQLIEFSLDRKNANILFPLDRKKLIRSKTTVSLDRNKIPNTSNVFKYVFNPTNR